MIRGGAVFITVMLAPVELNSNEKSKSLNFYHSEEKKAPTNKNSQRLTYVSYTKFNQFEENRPGLANGKVYIGRSSGYGAPENIVRLRNRYHHKNLQGYTPYGCLDQWALAFKTIGGNRRDDPSYTFIRGREQNVMEAMGGAWSDWGIKNKEAIKNTRSGNAINGIMKGSHYYYFATYVAKTIAWDPPITWNGSTNCQIE